MNRDELAAECVRRRCTFFVDPFWTKKNPPTYHRTFSGARRAPVGTICRVRRDGRGNFDWSVD